MNVSITVCVNGDCNVDPLEAVALNTFVLKGMSAVSLRCAVLEELVHGGIGSYWYNWMEEVLRKLNDDHSFSLVIISNQ